MLAVGRGGPEHLPVLNLVIAVYICYKHYHREEPNPKFFNPMILLSSPPRFRSTRDGVPLQRLAARRSGTRRSSHPVPRVCFLLRPGVMIIPSR